MEVQAPGQAHQALRRGRRDRGLRRAGPGRHLRAQDRGSARRAYRILVDRVGFPPEVVIFDPNVFAIATGIGEHANYAVDFGIRGHALDQAAPARRQGERRRVNVSFSFRGNDPVREAITPCSVPRHPGGHGHRASSTPAWSASTTTSTDASAWRTWCSTAARRGRAPTGDRRRPPRARDQGRL